MALDKVVGNILETANKESAARIATAEKERATILQQADETIASKKKAQEKELEIALKRLRQQEISSAELEAKSEGDLKIEASNAYLAIAQRYREQGNPRDAEAIYDKLYDAKVAQARFEGEQRVAKAAAADDAEKLEKMREEITLEVASINRKRELEKEKVRRQGA